MKAKGYFIIATAGVLAFAVYFQDYARTTRAARAQQAAIDQLARDQLAEEQRRERAGKLEAARLLALQRRMEQEERKRREAAEQADRDAVRQQLETTQSETAGLRRKIEHVTRTIDSEEKLLARATAERTSIAAERDFLVGYVADARASVERVQTTLENFARMEAERATAAATQTAGARRER